MHFILEWHFANLFALATMKQPVQTSAPLFPIDALPPKTRQLVGEIQQLSHASESTIVSAMLSAVATTAQRR